MTIRVPPELLKFPTCVDVWPVDIDGGEWGVIVTRGNNHSVVCSHFRLDDALKCARHHAELLGVEVDEGAS